MKLFVQGEYLLAQYENRKKASEVLSKMDTKPEDYIIIHYTCDDFKMSQIISSIAVRKLNDGQTESFSLYKTAQNKNINNDDIPDHQIEIEKEMLKDFYKFVSRNQNKHWIHWNMSSDNYGFKAIEHRYRVLGGKPKIIDDDKKIDLSHLFIQLYGKGYAKHPRMESLMGKNKISCPNDFLPGYSKENKLDEPKALSQKQYKIIQMSCLRKVDVFSNFITLAINGQLKVYTPWWSYYGVTIKGVLAMLNEKWWFKIVTYLLTFLLGINYAVLEPLGL